MDSRPEQFQNRYTKSLINRTHKCQATLFGHVMRREKLEHLVTTGMIEGKRSRGKHNEKMLDGQTKWLKVGRVIEKLKAMWKVMISYA